MPQHTISHADELYFGAARQPNMVSKRRGVRLHPIVQVDLGAPLTLDADGLIDAATGTELPDTETVTYTPANAGTSPVDGANTTWVLDVPRNITAAVSHGSSVVAMTILITGKDVYGQRMSELLTIAATGTSQTATGVKAFKSIDSIAITAAADAEANTLDVGFGDTLGLPYRLGGAYDILSKFVDGGLEAIGSGTQTAGVATTATTTTGDVRGTWLPATATNGTRRFRMWMKIHDPSTDAGAFGVTQA